MRTALFIIPTSYICKGSIPIDYRVEERNVDKRTRFFRNYAKWETSAFIAVSAAERIGLRVFRNNGKLTRILAPNAKTARAYFEYMQKFFGTNIREGGNK